MVYFRLVPAGWYLPAAPALRKLRRAPRLYARKKAGDPRRRHRAANDCYLPLAQAGARWFYDRDNTCRRNFARLTHTLSQRLTKRNARQHCRARARAKGDAARDDARRVGRAERNGRRRRGDALPFCTRAARAALLRVAAARAAAAKRYGARIPTYPLHQPTTARDINTTIHLCLMAYYVG